MCLFRAKSIDIFEIWHRWKPDQSRNDKDSSHWKVPDYKICPWCVQIPWSHRILQTFCPELCYFGGIPIETWCLNSHRPKKLHLIKLKWCSTINLYFVCLTNRQLTLKSTWTQVPSGWEQCCCRVRKKKHRCRLVYCISKKLGVTESHYHSRKL